MKIAISSTDRNMNAEVDQRFGRCKYFVLVDDETMDMTVIDNESNMISGGAGIKTAETIVRAGADAVITGNIGPNAFATLAAGKVKIYTGASGPIRESIKQVKNGRLKETEKPNVTSHAGIRGRA